MAWTPEKISPENFDRWTLIGEKAMREANVAGNAAFIAALSKAIEQGREKMPRALAGNR